MSIAAKVFNHAILTRVYDEISPRMHPFQAGFRRGKCCTEQIYIRQILEQYHQKSIPTVMTINRDTMWKILRHGVPEKIVNIIKYLYDGIQLSL